MKKVSISIFQDIDLYYDLFNLISLEPKVRISLLEGDAMPPK
jgi:hypothetical protein